MATFNVSTSAQLKSAISQASGGDVIRLAPGNYGSVDINREKHSSTVTIVSADAKRPAVIESLKVVNSDNLRFDNLKFDFTIGKGGSKPFAVQFGDKITFTNNVFDGDLNGRYPTFGNGLTVSDSTNVTVQNNEFFHFMRGAEFRKVTGLNIVNNEVHNVAGDGMVFAQIRNGLIQGNDMHSMKGDPKSNYHKDVFQFWTAGTDQPTQNVTVRGNRIETGDGSTQSIFFGNDLAKANSKFFYQNIVIENNKIIAGHYHGITMEEGNGVVIRNNTVVQDMTTGFNGQVNMPRITVSDLSKNITVTGNTAHEVPGAKGGWTISGNKIVSKGYKVSDGDKGVIKAPETPAFVPSPEPDKGAAAPNKPAPAPEKPAPVPEKPTAPPQTDYDGISIADLTKPQSQAFYAQLARDVGAELRANGNGGNTDAVVLASASTSVASAGNGNNILIGKQGADQLLSGVGENIMVGLGGADTFRFTGSHVRNDKTDAILDLNFAQGDKISFRGYEAGTFNSKGGGNRVDIFENGSSVIVDSILDIGELAAFSSGISASTRGSTLVLEISQKAGVQELELVNLAQAYNSIDSALF